MSHHHAPLRATSFGFALGVTWAIGLLVLGWAGWLSGWGRPMIEIIGTVYLGYKATFLGTIIGAVWGFVDLFVAGIIIAAIYNACVCGKSCSRESGTTSTTM